MARMPNTHWLGEHGSKAMSRYDIVCIHTIVGFAPAHAANFSTHHDGRIDQSRDTKFQSGANLEGNPRIIAIENEDHGTAYGTWNTNNGHAVPAFTSAQVEAIAQICAWAHKTHGIPLTACPDSKSSSRGIAYHRQGIDGNFGTYDYPGRVPGGEIWTEHFGKVCPGDRRIKQVLEEIIPRAKQIVSGEDDMSWDDGVIKTDSGGDLTNQQALEYIYNRQSRDVPDIDEIRTDVNGLITSVDALTTKVDGIVVGGVDYDILANKVADVLHARLES